MIPVAYVAMIEHEAKVHRVPYALLVSIIARESHWDTFAIGAANERGWMQIQPSVAREMCDWEPRLLHFPQPNVSCGARILRKHFKRCGSWLAAASAFNGSHACGITTYGLDVTR